MADTTTDRNSPFVIGVTGHRDLSPSDVPRVQRAVADFARRLDELLPNTELHVVVGMAEGADILIARTVLELGVHVEAVLPMALERYEADFGPESLAVLRELLRHPNVRTTEIAASPSDTARDSSYATLTATLIRRSSLLLAIWDGRASALPGGTADTLLRYLGARTEDNKLQESLEFIETDLEMEPADHLVFWIPAGRVDGPPVDEALAPSFVLGIGDNILQLQRSMPTVLARQIAELDAYNRDFSTLSAAGALGVPDSLLADVPSDVSEGGRAALRAIDTQYGKADVLAVHYQLRSNRLFGLFGVMTFTMGLAYLIYEKLTESRLLLFAYLAILLSSLGLYHLLQNRRWFAKHLTYRALAETMRAKFYLTLAGVDERVDAAEVLALSGINRFHGFSWLGAVLKAAEATGTEQVVADQAQARRSRRVEESWIEAQHRYFTAKVASLARSSRRVKLLRNALFVVILLVIITLFVFGEQLQHADSRSGVPLKNLLTFCMGFLAVLLGVWELHQDKMATHELLWQYRNQLNHFSRARQQLSRTASSMARNDVLVALGRDSLMESYLWTIHRYHREHEPPGAH